MVDQTRPPSVAQRTIPSVPKPTLKAHEPAKKKLATVKKAAPSPAEEKKTKKATTKKAVPAPAKKATKKAVATPAKQKQKKEKSQKASPTFDPLDFDPLVTSGVAKDFSGTVYHGTVMSRERVAGPSGKDLGWHYHVVYEDGDEEDVNARECKAMARLFEERTGGKNKAGKGAQGNKKRKKVVEEAEKPEIKKKKKETTKKKGKEAKAKPVWPGGSNWVPKPGE